MYNLLLTSAWGVPSRNSGGGTRVIYDILHAIPYEQFQCTFASAQCYTPLHVQTDLEKIIRKKVSLKSKFGMYAYRKSRIFKSIVGSDCYFLYYLHKISRKLTKSALIKEYDLIHAHDPLSLYYISRWAKNIPKVLTVHSKGGFVYERYTNGSQSCIKDYLTEIEKVSIDQADYIVFPSIAAKDLFIRNNQYTPSENKIKIIYNGVDLEYIANIEPKTTLFHEYAIDRTKYDVILINVAEHVVQKNIDMVLQIVGYLKNKYKVNPLLINIGGYTSLTNKLNKQIDELYINENVRFLGNLPNEKVIMFLKLSDMFLSTSYDVIFDLSVLEAMASGCPVIVSDNGGNREIIRNGFNGYLVPCNSLEKYAEVILEGDLSSVKHNASETIKHFTIYTCVQRYIDIYKSLLT